MLGRCSGPPCPRESSAGKRPRVTSATPDRHVDREEPGPRRDRQDHAADRRSRGDPRRHDQRVDSECSAELIARKDRAQQRRRERHDAGRAHALDQPRDDQQRQRRRERAQQRPHGEERHAVAPAAHEPLRLPERRPGEQRGGQRELKAVDHPNRRRRGDVQFPADRRQRDVRDRAVEHGHRGRRSQCQVRATTLGDRQPVGDHGVGVGVGAGTPPDGGGNGNIVTSPPGTVKRITMIPA